MRFYVASAVFFVLGCLFIGGAVWARLQIGREIFYRTSEFGLMQFKSYRYVIIFQLKQISIEILSKLGIWIGLFCFFLFLHKRFCAGWSLRLFPHLGKCIHY